MSIRMDYIGFIQLTCLETGQDICLRRIDISVIKATHSGSEITMRQTILPITVRESLEDILTKFAGEFK